MSRPTVVHDEVTSPDRLSARARAAARRVPTQPLAVLPDAEPTAEVNILVARNSPRPRE